MRGVTAAVSKTSILLEPFMSWTSATLTLGLLVLPPAPAWAQTRDNVARCLQLGAIYERHVAKNAVHPLPSMSVEISVAIEGCRQGHADGAAPMLEVALRAKGFQL
jgi:hypothetical protein